MTQPDPFHPVRPDYRWDLDVLRILSIMGVVSIHIFGLILGHPELRGTPTWTFGIVLDKIVVFCVPVFVMISGALLLDPAVHRRGARAFYLRRIRRLLPAVVFWHAFYIVVVRGWLLDQDLSAGLVSANLVDVKVYTGLYFFWVILGLYLVAPVLASFIAGDSARARIVALVAIAWSAAVLAAPTVMAQAGYARGRWDNITTMWLPFVGLFVAGYAWRHPRSDGRRWLWAGIGALLVLSFVTWQFGQIPAHPWLQAVLPVGFTAPLTALGSVLLVVAVIDVCARLTPSPRVVKVIRTLGEATFGVFVCHLVFLALFTRFAHDFYADPAPAAKTLLYVAVLGAAWLTALLARRIPGVSRLF